MALIKKQIKKMGDKTLQQITDECKGCSSIRLPYGTDRYCNVIYPGFNDDKAECMYLGKRFIGQLGQGIQSKIREVYKCNFGKK